MRNGRPGTRALLALLGLALFLGACGYGNDDTDTLGTDPYVTEGGTARVFAQFEPGIQIMPMPNDVVWSADEDPADPGIQLPASGALAQLAPVINALDLRGFSPNMFLTVPVTDRVDPSTLQAFVFRLDGQELPRTAASFQVLEEPIDDADPTTPAGVLKLLPNTPFTPGAYYAVAIKMGLEDANGFEVHPSLTMEALKSTTPFGSDSPFIRLEALRLGFNQGGLFDGLAAATGAVLGTPWTRDDVLVIWTFHTAAVTLDLPPNAQTPPPALAYSAFGAKMQTLRGLSALLPADPGLVWLNPGDGTPAAGPVGVSASDTLAGRLPDTTNLGNLYAGVFQSPNLSTGGATTTAVPFVLVTPSGGAAPYPVVLFQHPLYGDKTNSFALANELAGKGLAILAIDAPYHGDRAPIDEGTGEPLPSGTGFFTANLLADRLNVYQGAVDLWEAMDLIGNTGIDLDGLEGADLTSPRFVSHSLGSIIGSAFLNQDSRPEAILLSSPTAELVSVLDATTLELIRGVVASLGYTKGKTDYYVFLNLAQWLLDPVDGAYMGIGENTEDELLVVFAFDDPRVTADASRTFLAGIGVNPALEADGGDVVSVDPADVVPGTFPDFAAPAYEFGVSGHPIQHDFLLTPLFDTTAPWYAGYIPADQEAAWAGAQAQAAGFLAP